MTTAHPHHKQKLKYHHRGYTSAKESNRLARLVKRGLATYWQPYRNLNDAIKASGI